MAIGDSIKAMRLTVNQDYVSSILTLRAETDATADVSIGYD